MKFIFSTLFLICFSTAMMAQKEAANVVIHTDSGSIYLRLFDETPKHKENFLKLASEGFYDGIAFHRIIKKFMIQGGNPSNRMPNPATTDGPGYMLDAEIVPKYVHTRGMLAAARLGDNINPERKSSGSQFYIVTGNNVTDATLNQIENNINQDRQNQAMQKELPALQQQFLSDPANAQLFADYQALTASNDPKAPEKMQQLNEKFSAFLETRKPNVQPFAYTAEQRAAYKAKGGAPHLDMQYTVYGEVLEGMDVVAKLESVQTAPGDKPIKDVRITKVEILKK